MGRVSHCSIWMLHRVENAWGVFKDGDRPKHGVVTVRRDSLPERLGELGDIVQRQRHERAVRPEPAIGHQQMEVRVPVCQGAVRFS